MNYEQMQQLFKYCDAIGLKTVGELASFKAANGCRTNGELLSALEKAARGGIGRHGD